MVLVCCLKNWVIHFKMGKCWDSHSSTILAPQIMGVMGVVSYSTRRYAVASPCQSSCIQLVGLPLTLCECCWLKVPHLSLVVTAYQKQNSEIVVPNQVNAIKQGPHIVHHDKVTSDFTASLPSRFLCNLYSICEPRCWNI